MFNKISKMYEAVQVTCIRTDKGDYYVVSEIATIISREYTLLKDLLKILPKEAVATYMEGDKKVYVVQDVHIEQLVKFFDSPESRKFVKWVAIQMTLKSQASIKPEAATMEDVNPSIAEILENPQLGIDYLTQEKPFSLHELALSLLRQILLQTKKGEQRVYGEDAYRKAVARIRQANKATVKAQQLLEKHLMLSIKEVTSIKEYEDIKANANTLFDYCDRKHLEVLCIIGTNGTLVCIKYPFKAWQELYGIELDNIIE